MAPPYAASTVITGIAWTWASLVTLAPGSDNWPITWAANGHQYTSWGDGGGFGGTDQNGRVSLGVGRVEGPKTAYTGHNVYGGLNPENPGGIDGKSYGLVSIGGVLYMWVSPLSDTSNYDEARLYSSDDNGATWEAAGWAFTEAQGVVLPAFLQFGQDYAGARDGYAYAYFVNLQDATGLKVQIPGEIVLARCPIAELLTQGSWEWLSNLTGPTWSTTIANRVPVFENAVGGVGWNLSVSRNAPLQRYLLTTEHEITMSNRIGIFDAPEPWGPWTTVQYVEGEGWDGGQLSGGVFYGNFSNKWLSGDGKDFVFVFSGVGDSDRWNEIEGTFTAVTPAISGAGVLVAGAALVTGAPLPPPGSFGRSDAGMAVGVGQGMSAADDRRIPRGR